MNPKFLILVSALAMGFITSASANAADVYVAPPPAVVDAFPPPAIVYASPPPAIVYAPRPPVVVYAAPPAIAYAPPVYIPRPTPFLRRPFASPVYVGRRW